MAEKYDSLSGALRRGPRPALGDTSDYLLIRAPKGFMWRGEDAEGLPLLSERDGRLCEPLTGYFGESLRARRVAISSMYGEAGILREWWAYLDANGRRWDEVNDQTLIDWRTGLTQRATENLPSTERQEVDVHNRVARQLEVVFNFYLRAGDKAYGLSNRSFVGPRGPITSTLRLGGLTKHGRFAGFADPETIDAMMWKHAISRRIKIARRPTPDEEAVARILAYLRSPPEAPRKAPGSRGRPKNKALPERDWLLGRGATDAGLRAAENARLGLRAIAKGLSKAGVKLPTQAELDDLPSEVAKMPLQILDLIGFSPNARRSTISQLEHLRRRHHQHIFVLVNGKGSKAREVPFPIEYVQDLLTIGIWTIRQREIFKRGNSRQLPTDFVFVPDGSAALKGLTPGHIGDLLKAAFKAAKIDGSGHRLRAWYATKTCARLFEEAYALNGNRWDQAVENTVLDQLAQALGHSRVTTTVRSYLDMQLMRYFRLRDKSKLSLMRKTSWLLANASDRLEKKDFARIDGIVARLARGPALFRDLIDQILQDPDFAAPDDPPRSAALSGRPRLQLVPSGA